MTDCFDRIFHLKSSGEPCVFVTVVDKTGAGPCSVGAKMVVERHGEITGTVGGGRIEYIAIQKAVDIFSTHKSVSLRFDMTKDTDDMSETSLMSETSIISETSETFKPSEISKPSKDDYPSNFDNGCDNTLNSQIAIKTGMLCGGTATLFFDYIPSSKPIFIFGAGHIGKALCSYLKNLDYSITLLDNRQEFLESCDEPVNKIHIEYGELFKNFTIPNGSFVVIATHSHAYDYEALSSIYIQNVVPSYIGVIASKKKVNIFFERLKELDKDLNLSNLYMPAGYNTGGNTPFDIAISVIAQIQSIKNSILEPRHLRLTDY